MARIYKTPAAFKAALEAKLKERAKLRVGGLDRLRQRFVMERFLARVVQVFQDAATLKGGLALELRLANARSTKDIDLRSMGDPSEVLSRLRSAATFDLGDHLAFQVDPDPDHPNIDAVYEGRRFRVVCTLASMPYARPFGVDVGMADPMYGPVDFLDGEDFLDFVPVAPLRVPAYPVETHIAEKLHAYTRVFPPGRENSRHRDLPDLALLSGVRAIQGAALRAAIQTTFAFRKSHDAPASVPLPPASWDAPYRKLAAENALPWPTLSEVHAAVAAFLDPVLLGHDGLWEPSARAWRAV
jgi:hypothetical protein